MRRSLRVGRMVLILGTLVLVGRLASAPKQASAPATRVALINLNQVFKGYQKVTVCTNGNKKLTEPYQEKAKKLKEQIEAHAKALEDKELPEDTRKEHERKRKLRERKMEDLGNEAMLLYSMATEDLMLVIYKEVMAAAQRHAQAHDIDLVLHYSDVPAVPRQQWSPDSIIRHKGPSGACQPAFVAPGTDITNEIISALNDKYRSEQKTPQDKGND